MHPWDSRSMQVYIDAIQRNHPFTAVARNYNNAGTKPSRIEFYPHKRRPAFCLPFCCSRCTSYTFSLLAGVLAELEDCGWKRRVVYDFLHILVEESRGASGPEFHTFSKKISSHSFLTAVEDALVTAPIQEASKILLYEGQIQMWEGTGTEEVVTFEDLRWLANRGAVIRPQNEQVLEAIDSLDKAVGGGMWKFATAPSDVEGNHWQTVVKPRETSFAVDQCHYFHRFRNADETTFVFSERDGGMVSFSWKELGEGIIRMKSIVEGNILETTCGAPDEDLVVGILAATTLLYVHIHLSHASRERLLVLFPISPQNFPVAVTEARHLLVTPGIMATIARETVEMMPVKSKATLLSIPSFHKLYVAPSVNVTYPEDYD
ncbi:hypothetical protein M422DRAFT_257467 [Sphaerobolus stellatus SS14]|uniref:Uncharacterized protein n=1 Tax=Sphaerobolus stellatus (strain SS14) TaxID=990650 RepID=A0A0C9UXL7_SPHS4|nr:hypothetical protein M422DRAFT_257467 [Sphaerobolus stellatus SS14]